MRYIHTLCLFQEFVSNLAIFFPRIFYYAKILTTSSFSWLRAGSGKRYRFDSIYVTCFSGVAVKKVHVIFVLFKVSLYRCLNELDFQSRNIHLNCSIKQKIL